MISPSSLGPSPLPALPTTRYGGRPPPTAYWPSSGMNIHYLRYSNPVKRAIYASAHNLTHCVIVQGYTRHLFQPLVLLLHVRISTSEIRTPHYIYRTLLSALLVSRLQSFHTFLVFIPSFPLSSSTMCRHSLSSEVIHFVHTKGCIGFCIRNIQLSVDQPPLDLVEIFATIFCCLKDSSDMSQV